MSNLDSVSDLKEQLLRSHWPKCNELAKALTEQGGVAAQEALLAALKVRRHHVRTAAIEALAGFGDPSLPNHIEPFLCDLSYETRMAAKAALQRLTGRNDIVTARGE